MTAITLAVIFFICMSILILSLQFKDAKVDEYFHHYPTFLSFYGEGLSVIYNKEAYKSAYPPLPFMLSFLTVRLFYAEPNLSNLRIINAVISFIAIILIYFLMRKQMDASYIFPALLIFLFYPFFLKYSFSFYLGIYGLFLFILFLVVLNHSKDSLMKEFTLGIVSLLVGLSQQYLLIIPIFYLAYKVKARWKEKTKEDILRFSLFIIPALFLISFYFSWGGLTADSYRYHGVSFRIQNMTVLMIITGAWFLPYLLENYKKIRKKDIYIGVASAFVMGIFFYPEFGNRPEKGFITGMTFNVIAHIEKISALSGMLAKILLIFAAYLILKTMLTNFAVYDFKVWIAAGLALVFLFTELLSERHLIPLIFTLYFIILPQIKEKKVIYGWAAIQVIIGILYFYKYLVNTRNYPVQGLQM